MQRYREYVKKMIDENKKLFEAFQRLHDEYALNPDANQERFNKEGEKVLEVVREYENRVCANQERGMYNKFSANLADKFQNEVRKVFPMIDHVGLKVEKPNKEESENLQIDPDPLPNFAIKKIEVL